VNKQEQFKRLVEQADRLWMMALQGMALSQDAYNFCATKRIDPAYFGFIPSGTKLRLFDEVMMKRLNGVLYDRLLFPLRAPNGVILGFGSRSIADGVKYLYYSLLADLPTRSLFYGLDFVIQRSNSELWVVEGVTDVLALRGVKIDAVGALGARLVFEQAAIIVALSDKIALCFDNDPAGHAAVVRAVQELAKFDCVPSLIFPELGGDDPKDCIEAGRQFIRYDVAPWIREHEGAEAVERLISLYASEAARVQLSAQLEKG